MGPTLLIASPQMEDVFFKGTVVLLWHHDEDGAIGVVINRPIEGDLSDVIALDGAEVSPALHAQLSWGGPVDTDSGTVITRSAVDPEEGWSLPCGLSVTRSQDALMRLLGGPHTLRLCVGYAGWGPGQLDRELGEGGWLFTDVDPGLVLDEDPETTYASALATLGLAPTTVWMRPVEA